MTPFDHPFGLRLEKPDARDKATGRAIYTDDMVRPRMLWGALVQSPYPHARIRGYDTSEAKAAPGVKAVITGADFDWHYAGAHVKDETLLAKEKVRYIGEPVAAVAATTREAAEAAARLIQIDYEPLDAVFTIDEALAPGAPLLHENFARYKNPIEGLEVSGNECWNCSIVDGDVDSAWAACDAIFEGEYETQAQHHVFLEPASALAEIDANGKVTIWGPNQGVHYVQHRTADLLGLPFTRLRAISPAVGGGFGGRAGPHVQPIAAALAMASGRPVKITLNRAADFETGRSRHPSRTRIKIGAKKDGTLVALDADILMDGGAYCDESGGVCSFAVIMARGPYRIPHARARARAVYTNKLRAGSFRGFGNPQSAFAREAALDALAERLGMDPVALRLKNAMGSGERWFGGQTVPACGVRDCVEKVQEAVARDTAADAPPAPGKRRGIGYSAFAHISSFLASSATVRLCEDGSLALGSGAVDMGQGSDGIMTQICAETLLVPVSRISTSAPDTDTSPYNFKSVGSRTTYTTGRAVNQAAAAAGRAIVAAAADMLGCAADDLELVPGGAVGVREGSPKRPTINRTVSFEEIGAYTHYRAGGPIIGSGSVMYDGSPFDRERCTLKGLVFRNIGAYIFGAQAVEVEVDDVTGKVSCTRAWSACDVGRAVNPTSVEGQIEGGFAQGLGYALFEEMVWEGGRLANPSLMDYKAPGAEDVPPKLVSIIVEVPEPSGPFGAKGVGEPALVGVAPAVANAIAAAAKIRLTRLPMTAERVLDALDAAQS
ncbi:MAG: xanthine dehydrogenase family protein [Rhodospirillaceae bacterium]|nr:xanthine dehydrogenase family protein [Rhodospirillaceae bacterium]